MHVPLPEDSAAVRRKLIELVEANAAYNCTLRVVVVRNGGGMWAGPSNGRASDLIALTAESKDWGDGVKLAYQENARHAANQLRGDQNSIVGHESDVAPKRRSGSGFDEVILLNERGEVAECTSANIFIANGNEVWTPPLNSGCLPGITRELLLSEVRAEGIEGHEKPITRRDLEAADEVFITSTTRDLLPVSEVEGKKGRTDAQAKLVGLWPRCSGQYVRNYVAEIAAQTYQT